VTDNEVIDNSWRYEIAVYDEGIIGIEVWLEGEGGQYIVIEPITNEQGVEDSWLCYGQDIDNDLLPIGCQ